MTRRDVALPHAYRLLNHGPTVLVSAAHAGRANVMAAAWAMPLDFDPPKVTVVIDKSSFTRRLIEASGAFALSVPAARWPMRPMRPAASRAPGMPTSWLTAACEASPRSASRRH